MLFQNLSEDLNVGLIHLRPCTPCPQLQPCFRCGFVKLRYVTCNEHSHAVCDNCSLRRGGGRRWCQRCEAFVETTPRSVAREVLAAVVFECPCGLKGTLGEVREHLIRDGLHPLGNNNDCEKDPVSDHVADALQRLTLRDATHMKLSSGKRHRRNCACFVWFDFDELYGLFQASGKRTRSSKMTAVIGDLPIEIFLVLDKSFSVEHVTVVAMVAPSVKDDVPLPLRNELRLTLIDARRLPLPVENYIKAPKAVESDRGALLAAQSAVVCVDVLKKKLLLKRNQICVRIELCPVTAL